MAVTHAKVSGISDGGDASLVRPSDWNAGHTVTGLLPGSVGSAFPGGPATSDLFFRTDLGLLYYYDGTRWLTAATFAIPLGPTMDQTLPSATANGLNMGRASIPALYDTWLVSMEWHSLVRTTNNGSNFWTAALIKYTGAGVGTTIISPTTASDTAGQFKGHSTAIGALVQSSAHQMMQVEVSKTGSPGAYDFSAFLVARWVG